MTFTLFKTCHFTGMLETAYFFPLRHVERHIRALKTASREGREGVKNDKNINWIGAITNLGIELITSSDTLLTPDWSQEGYA